MPDKLRFLTIAALALSVAPDAVFALAGPGPRVAQSGSTAPEAPPPDKGPASTNEPPKTVLEKEESQGILGKTVRDSAGKEMGRIVNVIVDRASQPRAVVIDFGGFLGVGSRKIAVDWAALRIGADKPDQITLDLSRDQVRAAPEYKDGAPVVVLGAAGATRPLPGNGSEKAEP
ncbi:MAG TPA: PRC-barrel domain-containing protein [Alphaproteobacteria bacterium]|nr:PRC-barrel domain-containing protein [Alphaproteobacteria bacterium]